MNVFTKVTRSEKNSVFTGVCAALSRRFGINCVLLRVVAVILMLHHPVIMLLMYFGLTVSISKR